MSRGRGRRGAQSAVMTMFKQSKDCPAPPGLIASLQAGQSMVGFPALDVRRLAPVLSNQAHEYMVTVRAQQVARLREGPRFVKSARRARELPRYSERAAGGKSGVQELEFDPRMLPAELLWRQPGAKASQAARSAPADEDISAIIARLEQADVAPPEPEPERAESPLSGEEEEEEEPGQLVIDDFGEDDEDNDYVQSYFDNGEAYAHEDDLGGAADDPFD